MRQNLLLSQGQNKFKTEFAQKSKTLCNLFQQDVKVRLHIKFTRAFSTLHCVLEVPTVKLVYNDHPRGPNFVAVVENGRCSFML